MLLTRVLTGGVVGALLAVLAIGASLARAITVFEDGFDAETGSGQCASGQSKINYAAFASWVVSDGTVDLTRGGGPFSCSRERSAGAWNLRTLPTTTEPSLDAATAPAPRTPSEGIGPRSSTPPAAVQR